jgi:hypothetical protein
MRLPAPALVLARTSHDPRDEARSAFARRSSRQYAEAISLPEVTRAQQLALASSADDRHALPRSRQAPAPARAPARPRHRLRLAPGRALPRLRRRARAGRLRGLRGLRLRALRRLDERERRRRSVLREVLVSKWTYADLPVPTWTHRHGDTRIVLWAPLAGDERSGWNGALMLSGDAAPHVRPLEWAPRQWTEVCLVNFIVGCQRGDQDHETGEEIPPPVEREPLSLEQAQSAALAVAATHFTQLAGVLRHASNPREKTAKRARKAQAE